MLRAHEPAAEVVPPAGVVMAQILDQITPDDVRVVIRLHIPVCIFSVVLVRVLERVHRLSREVPSSFGHVQCQSVGNSLNIGGLVRLEA